MAQFYLQKVHQTAWCNIYAIFTVNNCDFFQILTKCHLKKYALYAKECTGRRLLKMETKTKQQLKEEQLAKALRDNLRRRKAQDNDKNKNKEK